jgi:hypothetical protein
MGLLSILVALGLLIWLAYRGWSVLLLAPAAMILVAQRSHWYEFRLCGAGFVGQPFDFRNPSVSRSFGGTSKQNPRGLVRLRHLYSMEGDGLRNDSIGFLRHAPISCDPARRGAVRGRACTDASRRGRAREIGSIDPGLPFTLHPIDERSDASIYLALFLGPYSRLPFSQGCKMRRSRHLMMPACAIGPEGTCALQDRRPLRHVLCNHHHQP